jgi:DNA-binding NarL/FixJ family response regulator
VAELHLSAYTVKDHLKAILDNVGVRSRRDLVAHVLLDQQIAKVTALSSPSSPTK